MAKYFAKSCLVITKPLAVQELPQLMRSPKRKEKKEKKEKEIVSRAAEISRISPEAPTDEIEGGKRH